MNNLFIATLLSLNLGMFQATDKQVQNFPNVLVILADDLGFGDVQCNNPTRGKIKTPYIDNLAAQGMRFTDAHSSSGVCSPSVMPFLQADIIGAPDCNQELSAFGGNHLLHPIGLPLQALRNSMAIVQAPLANGI
ncbi:MAG: hypothetical protein EBQ87_03110 [Planctomycetes bacterium]|nr:hypothetical protein [Planctomycetota bacterium]